MGSFPGRNYFCRAVSFDVKGENIGNVLVKQGINSLFINLSQEYVSNSMYLITVKNNCFRSQLLVVIIENNR